jgi:hypothetical protein
MTFIMRVSRINKQEHYNPHERIINIGGINAEGVPWKLSQDKAIEYIENGKYSFYLIAGGCLTEVVIGTHKGKKYLRTSPDAAEKDILLSLPECP